MYKESLHIGMAPLGCRMNRNEGRELTLFYLRLVKKTTNRRHGKVMKQQQAPPPAALPQPHHQTSLALACSASDTTAATPTKDTSTRSDVIKPTPKFRYKTMALATPQDAG